MNICLDYPILQPGSMGFQTPVKYYAEALIEGSAVYITHVLSGNSIVSQLINDDNAKFGSTLLYNGNSIKTNSFDVVKIEKKQNTIIANQKIDLIFKKDFPDVMPCIIALKDFNSSKTHFKKYALTDFWKGVPFSYKKYSRIALTDSLTFLDGSIGSLIKIVNDTESDAGEIFVDVLFNEHGSEQPVIANCATDVYKSLSVSNSKIVNDEPTAMQAFNMSILTLILTAAYIKISEQIKENEDWRPQGVLEAHLEMLKQKTKIDWKVQEFDPEKAATMMKKLLPDNWRNES